MRSPRPESRARNCIIFGDLDDPNAKKGHGVVGPSIGFASRAEFRRNISDIAASYRALARKTAHSNRRAQDHLRSARGAEHIEWHLRNERIRKVVRPIFRKFMLFGTTWSDVDKSELKRRFGGISHINAPSLRFSRRISQISNMVAITSDIYNPTSSHMMKGLVFRRRLNSRPICSEWNIWWSGKASSCAPEKHAIVHRRAMDSVLPPRLEEREEESYNVTRPEKETPYRQYKGMNRKK